MKLLENWNLRKNGITLEGEGYGWVEVAGGDVWGTVGGVVLQFLLLHPSNNALAYVLPHHRIAGHMEGNIQKINIGNELWKMSTVKVQENLIDLGKHSEIQQIFKKSQP